MEYKYINETLKDIIRHFHSLCLCVLVGVGNRREVNTSAYLSHWFQGSCYELSLQISSLCCLQPTSNTITPLHRSCQVRYFNNLLTDPLRFKAGKPDWRSPDFKCPCMFFLAHVFPGPSACAQALRGRKVPRVSRRVSVQLTISWHGGCNRAGQDRSGPLFASERHLKRARGHIWGMWAVASTGNKH